MSASVVDDMINCFLFAFIINAITLGQSETSVNLGLNFLLIAAVFVMTLIVGRRFIDNMVDWVHKRVVSQSGFTAFIGLLILLFSGLAEFIGVHAFGGAFLVGIMVTRIIIISITKHIG